MSIDLIPEEDLRAALRPYRVDPDAFEAAVRERLKAAEKQQQDEPLARLSPWLRSAAAFLPLEVLAGCESTTAAQLAPAGGAYKLLSYLAFPAISVFVLLGATIISIFKIRSIRNQTVPGQSDQMAFPTAMQKLGWRHMFGALVVFAATLILSSVGAAWLVFVVYIVSFGLLLQVLTTLAKHGLGNRVVIGQFCGQGLLFLGIGSQSLGIFSDQEIHFVDQKLIWAVFLGGVYILLLINLVTLVNSPLTVQGFGMGHQSRVVRLFAALVIAVLGLVIPLLVLVQGPVGVRILNPILHASPAQIKGYVESFAEAPNQSATWHQWEIVARWAIDSKLDPDLSKPRQLLDKEIAGEQNRYILGSALRVGLLPADQLGQLKEYERWRRLLLAAPPRGEGPQAILSLDQQDWVIRVAALRNDLSLEEQDRLEQRLLATLEKMSSDPYVTLTTALRVTQLLDVIERPLDRAQYREKMHDWLRKFHNPKGQRFQPAGGFKKYLNIPAGSLDATAHAVELIEIYGVPDDLDLNSVRSFLRPEFYRYSDQKWIAAATLDRLNNLNHLPGVTPPTWLEYLYYERTLLAATVLVGLCIYATLSAPKPKATETVAGSAANLKQAGEMD